MLSSFTKDEKKLLVLALGLFFFGSLAVPYYKQKQNSSVFQAGQKQTTSTLQLAGIAAPATASLLPLAPVTADGKIDLNKADAKALEALPGVGPSRARDIIAYRTQSGGFRSVDELDNVKGFGAAMMQKVREHAFVEAGAVPPPPAQTPPPQNFFPTQPGNRGDGADAQPPPTTNLQPSVPVATALVNINTATLQELETLKGVGPALGQRIIDYRNHYGRFVRPEDIEKVKGVGARIIQNNRHRLTVR